MSDAMRACAARAEQPLATRRVRAADTMNADPPTCNKILLGAGLIISNYRFDTLDHYLFVSLSSWLHCPYAWYEYNEHNDDVRITSDSVHYIQ